MSTRLRLCRTAPLLTLHSYAFTSPTSAKLQEIGPRFTLKLRWLRKGLPSVRTADGRMPTGGDKGATADEEFAIDDESDVEEQEKMDEEEAAAEMGQGKQTPAATAMTTPSGQAIPGLDAEQEYEWKWKVSSSGSECVVVVVGSVSLTIVHSPRWRCRAARSSCSECVVVCTEHGSRHEMCMHRTLEGTKRCLPFKGATNGITLQGAAGL